MILSKIFPKIFLKRIDINHFIRKYKPIVARTIACVKWNRPSFESDDDQFFTKIEEQARSDFTHLRSTLCNSKKIRVSIPRKETRESRGANRFCLHDERNSGSGGILDMSPREIAILSSPKISKTKYQRSN